MTTLTCEHFRSLSLSLPPLIDHSHIKTHLNRTQNTKLTQSMFDFNPPLRFNVSLSLSPYLFYLYWKSIQSNFLLHFFISVSRRAISVLFFPPALLKPKSLSHYICQSSHLHMIISH